MIALTNDFLGDLIALLIGVGAPLDGAELVLFTNSPDIDKDTVAGDLTAPTFTGYAAAALTFAEVVDSDGRKLASAGPITFSATNATNLPLTIRGAGVLNGGGDLICAGMFTTPIIMTAADQPFHVSAKVPIGDSAAIFEANFE